MTPTKNEFVQFNLMFVFCSEIFCKHSGLFKKNCYMNYVKVAEKHGFLPRTDDGEGLKLSFFKEC